MNSKLVNLTYEVQLQSGETLVLPDSITNSLNEGRWLATIQPAESSSQRAATSTPLARSRYCEKNPNGTVRSQTTLKQKQLRTLGAKLSPPILSSLE
jgi:hypothetical protein